MTKTSKDMTKKTTWTCLSEIPTWSLKTCRTLSTGSANNRVVCPIVIVLLFERHDPWPEVSIPNRFRKQRGWAEGWGRGLGEGEDGGWYCKPDGRNALFFTNIYSQFPATKFRTFQAIYVNLVCRSLMSKFLRDKFCNSSYFHTANFSAKFQTQTLQDCKTLPREHFIGCQGVKFFLLKDAFTVFT